MVVMLKFLACIYHWFIKPDVATDKHFLKNKGEKEKGFFLKNERLAQLSWHFKK